MALSAVLVVGEGYSEGAWAQAPAPAPSAEPSTPQQGPQQQQPEQIQPAPTEQLAPLQQFLIQQPGRPLTTPATPPGTTLPPWTPPVPPAPSQTNLPVPFFVPGAPGGPAAAGMPALAIPGLFAPTITNIRGATLELHPTARLGEVYSDNFFQTTSQSQENFRTILGPGFRLLMNGARTFGTGALIVDLVHDTAPNSGDEVKVFPSLDVAIRYALTPRLALTFTDTFIRNDEPANADQFGIRRGRQIFDNNRAGVAVDWLLDQVATQAYYRNVLFFNEGGANTTTGGTTTTTGFATTEDTITHIFGLNATTRIATDYLVRGGYEFSNSDTVNNSSSSSGIGGNNTTNTFFASASRLFGLYTTAGVSSSYSMESQDNTNIFNVALFGAYGLPNGLALSAAVGYSILNSDTQSNEGTISVNALASYHFARAFISVGAFQDFQQTAQQGQNFGTVETRSYFGQFLYQLTPFINVVLDARYSEDKPTGTGNVQSNQSLNTLSYGAGLNWLVSHWLTATVRYDYVKHSGNTNAFNQGIGSTDNFAENRATLNLFATF